MDQNPFAAFEPRLPEQRVIGGEERDRDRRAGFEAQRIRQLRGQRRRNGDVGGEGRRAQARHPVAGLEVAHRVADPHHAAGAFEAERWHR